MACVLTAWRPRPPMREQEWTAADIAGTVPLWPSAVPSRFRTPADGLPPPVSARRLRWLEEPVAGLAAAGGMQPAPVDAGEPGG
jgi:hypothetical protein